MDFGDLFQLVIFVLIILSALFGTRRRKQKQERPAARPRHPVRHRREPGPARRPPGARPREVPTATRAQVERSWLDVLREQLEAAQGLPPVPAPEPPHAEEAQSLETLEPAGGESHRRFHERYIEPSEPPPGAAARRPRWLPALTPRTARQAVVWREIFGPPKGLP